MMQDWAAWAIETAKRRGATYSDARVMDIRQREIGTKNGEVGTLVESETLGIGIRVIAGGAWGFASTDRLTREGVQACAAEAVAIAKASALAKRADVALAARKTACGHLAESVPQRSLPHSGRAADRRAARRRQRNDARERRHARRRLDVLQAH